MQAKVGQTRHAWNKQKESKHVSIMLAKLSANNALGWQRQEMDNVSGDEGQ